MIKKILITFGILFATFGFTTAAVQAYQIDPSYRPINSPFDLKDELAPTGDQQWNTINATILVLQILAGGLLYFASPVAIAMIVFAGFNMAIYSADSEKIDTAKKHLTWSVLGLTLIILSFSLVRILLGFMISNASNL